MLPNTTVIYCKTMRHVSAQNAIIMVHIKTWTGKQVLLQILVLSVSSQFYIYIYIRMYIYITNKSKNESCRPIFKKLKIFTVICLFVFKTLCFFRKYNIRSEIQVSIDTIPEGKMISMYFSVLHLCIRKVLLIWLHKSLPSELKELGDFKKFKRALKLFLLNNPFYSLSEFSTYGQ
jgi:hypothetical protein